MAFNFSVQDTQTIPGLTRPWETGTPFLTPVFFDLDLLIRYFYNPKYICEFYGETYGKIECPESAQYYSHFPFGINPNQKVIAWLGDIERLEPNEKLYLESHNVPSDGNIDSEFYDGQIGTEFAEPIREVELILYKTKISELTQRLYGFPLYKTVHQNVSEIVSFCSKYKRIVFNSEDDFKRFMSIWNEYLIEDLNVDGLKQHIEKEGISLDKGIKGLKLLEKFFVYIVGITENIIAPLFYLYDFRLWSDHSNMQEYYDGTVTKLGLASTNTFSEIYSGLINEIYNFYKELNTQLIAKL